MTRAAGLALALVLTAACGKTLDQQQQAIHSIRATTTSVLDAWLSGQVSTSYAHVALKRAHRLAEQTRAELASSPETLAAPRAADLTQACERMSRQIADLLVAVVADDRARAQRLRATVENIEPS